MSSTAMAGSHHRSGTVSTHCPQALGVVAHGNEAFAVPREALTEFVWPLVGVEYGQIAVPREDRLEELRAFLAAHYEGSRSWKTRWVQAWVLEPRLFHFYSMLILPEQSASIPAGIAVFQSQPFTGSIPMDDLRDLSSHQESLVRRSVEEAFDEFPLSKYQYHYLKPVYVKDERGVPRLAQPHDVITAIERIKARLHRYCYYVLPFLRLVQRLQVLTEVAARTIQDWSAIAVTERREWQRLRRYHSSLETIDPLITFTEPSWKLPYHNRDVRLHRRVIHWDDHDVVTLNVS